MKHLFAILMALAVFAATASAQSYQNFGSQQIVTNQVVTEGATSNLNVLLDVRSQENVCIYIKGAGTVATNGAATVFSFQKALDQSHVDTNSTAQAVGLNFTVTAGQTLVTNLNCTGIGYLKLTTVANANVTSAVTNLSVWYAIKR